MNQTNIEKTVFYTHHDQFEFSIMPLGLTDVPSTYQALMNEVFPLHLQKIVLVFFGSILAYKFGEEHLQHIKKALELLRAHHSRLELNRWHTWGILFQLVEFQQLLAKSRQ